MPLKIGVLGAGHLGKIHIKCIGLLPETYSLVGFYDPNNEAAAAVEATGLKRYDSVEALVEDVDVIDIVTPTLSHFNCAVTAIRRSRHVFIEKPITHTIEQARTLIKLSEEAGIKAQVGHVERYNPAFVAARPFIQSPMFIENHRLSEFNPRGTDVSVVMDLMIHDIDSILAVVKSNVKRISASGAAVVSDTPDIANARIEFDNGCVANLTASRISMKTMRKSRLFQKDAYITVDYFEKTAEVVRMKTHESTEENPYAMVLDLPDGSKKQIYFEQPKVEEGNAIKDELKALADAINNNHTPDVTLEDGYRALEVAHQISEQLENSLNVISK
ncbi:Gfo/Idh/MocA family protein [Phaeocystidibacter marisrubri]|uniref:Gfo/Idh/MocA family oxidoreductase n=1 Tax=Phaeocystidibacter marisrubri TaxID=1577780 RepID=A0A6L3ZKJ1_9FLAO|nr:Gfo/Idh/MocA family oxidoreductase [Phaeocystidibacter marisrubri]KAB2817680.1 Gfo/Idh/MocA family oxidoreductase [Phaeocystidibacter marisrubri]GGH74130.1 oxidoreductase [Phaeocystidibacter marisrubri]